MMKIGYNMGMSLKRSQVVWVCVVALMAVMLIGVENGNAFDGKLKGFVAGFGGGFAPVSRAYHTYKIGVVGEIFFGYAWNNSNIIVIGNQIETHKSYGQVYKSFHGIELYHYRGEGEHRFFSKIGLGMVIPAYIGAGVGLSVGVGYEFMKHMRVGIYYIEGVSSTVKENFVLNVFISVVGY
jgi:hypothetical protein